MSDSYVFVCVGEKEIVKGLNVRVTRPVRVKVLDRAYIIEFPRSPRSVNLVNPHSRLIPLRDIN